jgi:large subunit ribosomal protein L5
LSEEEQQSAEQDAPAEGQEEATAPANDEKPNRIRKRAASSAGSSSAAPGVAKPARAASTRSRAAAAKVESATENAAPEAKAALAKREKRVAAVRSTPRLLARYDGEIKGQLQQEFGYKSTMQVPGVKKVVVNVGLGEALTNAKALETTPAQIAAITGQKPVITKARRSIAGFKLREEQAIGVMVTLRGRRMYEFLDRMISMALPRIRDFRGVSRTAFDGNGNYSLGLREQIMFPEIDYGSIDRVRGMQVVITTSAKTDPEGFRLLELMGMPFAREGQTR